jgi:uncharacterized damage-inducible protein DinB
MAVRRSVRSADPEVGVLLRMMNQAFNQKGWHGTTLRGALRGVSPEAALWRPAPGRHNIWELTLHTAYWKYVVCRRVTGNKAGSFPRGPSNWPDLPPEEGVKEWKSDIRLLEAEHTRLVSIVAGLRAPDLERRSPKGTWTFAEEIQGVAAHDLYHTGQIQLIKRLMP